MLFRACDCFHHPCKHNPGKSGKITAPGVAWIGRLVFNYSGRNSQPIAWAQDYSVMCKRIWWRFWWRTRP